MKAGLLLFLTIVAAAFWWWWIRTDDPDTSWKVLVVASGVTLIGIYVAGSKKVSRAMKEWDREYAIEAARERQAAAQKEAAKSGLLASESTSESGSAAAVAQVNAVADPATARSLQELQKLLYTRAITDEEFESAKSRLFVSHAVQTQNDTVDQLQKLAALRDSGVLTEVEFDAVKLRLLGLD